jgi:hypothetical protein
MHQLHTIGSHAFGCREPGQAITGANSAHPHEALQVGCRVAAHAGHHGRAHLRLDEGDTPAQQRPRAALQDARLKALRAGRRAAALKRTGLPPRPGSVW